MLFIGLTNKLNYFMHVIATICILKMPQNFKPSILPFMSELVGNGKLLKHRICSLHHLVSN